MNTIGKILVICNLLVALAVGGFLIVDFQTRTNWKTAYDSLKREMIVRDAHYSTSEKTAMKLNVEFKKVQEDLKIDRMQIIEKDATHQAEMTGLKAEMELEKLRTKDAELTNQRYQGEVDRLKEEVKGLLLTLQTREKKIISQEDDLKNYRSQAIAAKNEADTMKERNERLRDQIGRLEQSIAEMQNRSTTEVTIVRDPNQPNPPTTPVKGVIEKINNQDRSLVQVSVGTDHGVNKNHTLEVYRTSPRPEYLGTIRIIESNYKYAVGKLMRSNLPRSPLQEGDIVAGSISNP